MLGHSFSRRLQRSASVMYPLKENGLQLSSLEGYNGPCKGRQAGQMQWHREEGGMGRMPREWHTQSCGEDGDRSSSGTNGSGRSTDCLSSSSRRGLASSKAQRISVWAGALVLTWLDAPFCGDVTREEIQRV